MVHLVYQRKMASKIMKCGIKRVYLDPNKSEDISEAVTRSDVRSLIKNGMIWKKQKKGVSRGRARHIAEQKAKRKRKGPGSRKGAKYARFPKKERWMRTIRPIREKLKAWREDGTLDRAAYRKYYRQAKAGVFKSKRHLETQLQAENAFKKPLPKASEDAK